MNGITLSNLQLVLGVVSAVVLICGTVFVWGIRLERRFGEALTRQEHDDICTENQEQIKRDLDGLREHLKGIRDDMRRNEERAATTRHDIRDTVHTLQTAVEVLKKECELLLHGRGATR